MSRIMGLQPWAISFALLLTVGAVGFGVDRLVRRGELDLARDLIVHHFERSSWFALNADRYDRIAPELARDFRESAAWHARRAREFQRLAAFDPIEESEHDAPHDREDARLMEWALRCDAELNKRREQP